MLETDWRRAGRSESRRDALSGWGRTALSWAFSSELGEGMMTQCGGLTTEADGGKAKLASLAVMRTRYVVSPALKDGRIVLSVECNCFLPRVFVVSSCHELLVDLEIGLLRCWYLHSYFTTERYFPLITSPQKWLTQLSRAVMASIHISTSHSIPQFNTDRRPSASYPFVFPISFLWPDKSS